MFFVSVIRHFVLNKKDTASHGMAATTATAGGSREAAEGETLKAIQLFSY